MNIAVRLMVDACFHTTFENVIFKIKLGIPSFHRKIKFYS